MNDDIEILENQILASFIVDKDTHRYIRELDENIFTLMKSKKLFNIIKKIYLNNEEVNIITINNYLTTGLESKNYYEELCKLTDSLVTSANFNQSLDKLKDINTRKKISNIISNALNNLKKPDIEVSSIKNYLIKNMKDINDNKLLNSYEDVTNVFSNTLDFIEKKTNEGRNYDLYTGIFDLDTLTDGLHGGELTAIGARPGTGKTTFAMQIACNIASKKKNVYFCSLEMSSNQLMQKILSNYAKVNSQFLRNGLISKEEMMNIANITNKITSMSLKIDTKSRYIEDIENIAYLLKDNNLIDVLFIDYLTLLKTKKNFAIRELEVAEISRRLKLLALDLDIPVVILVQLNREAENKKPTMANIRESGSIEQNCDNVIFLYDENSDEKKTITDIKVILEKQRQGSTGFTKVRFNKKYSKFLNYEK